MKRCRTCYGFKPGKNIRNNISLMGAYFIALSPCMCEGVRRKMRFKLNPGEMDILVHWLHEEEEE